MENYGFSPKMEKETQDGSEWQFGAGSPDPLFVMSEKDRVDYLPRGEVQRGREDTMDCATRGPVNKLEAEFTFAVQNNLFSNKNLAWLKAKGYCDKNGRVTFSDAFNAILSGTTRYGNSLKAPIHSIHRDGMIPKHMLPLEKDMTWEEYHDPKRITREMRDLGKAFSQRFNIYYEQVRLEFLKEANDKEMLVVAGHAWPQPNRQGIYPRVSSKANHVWVNVHPEYIAFDNYIDSHDGDFIKKLAKDFAFYGTAYRVFVASENLDVDDGWWFVKFLTALVAKVVRSLGLFKKFEPV